MEGRAQLAEGIIHRVLVIVLILGHPELANVQAIILTPVPELTKLAVPVLPAAASIQSVVVNLLILGHPELANARQSISILVREAI